MNLLPNFLIVGAAKAGTTTVNYYLDKNEEVFMSFPKEPKFFSYKYASYMGPGDISYTEKRVIKDYESYKKLFNGRHGFKAIGEASVDNLFYYKEVIPDIKKVLGDPKIIILLRNPVDRALSAYSHMIRDGRENMELSDALNLEEKRLKEGYEFIWGYRQGGLYHDQVKAYLDNFTQVKIVLFEDLIKDDQSILNDICNFLEVKHIKVEENLKLNASGRTKNKVFHYLLTSDTWLRRMMTSMVGTQTAVKIKSFLQSKNIQKLEYSTEIKQSLQAFFLKDITQLELLINRDLSLWKNKY